MEKVESQFKVKLNKIGDLFSPYFYGKFFPVQIALLVVLCFIAKTTLVALAIISILAAFVLIFYKNVAPIIPMLFMVLMAFTDFEIMGRVLPYILLSPAIIAFIARPFIHPIKKQKLGLLVIPLLLVSLALGLGGILRDEHDFSYTLAQFLSLGPTMLLIYLFFSFNIPKKDNFCIKEYLCYNFIVGGLAMALEIAYVRFYLQAYGWTNPGWINVNGCASFVLLAIPSCCYLIVKSKEILFYIICLLCLYFSLFVFDSYLAIGICFAYTPFLIFYTYRNMRRNNRLLLLYTILFVSVITLFVLISVFAIYEFDVTSIQLTVTSLSRERDVIYYKAIELFKENPLFGYGFQFFDDSILVMPDYVSSIIVFNFHSTLFHVLATMGLFGLIVYAVYFFTRFYILMRKNNSFTFMMLIGFIMFESHAMIDLAEFNAIPLMSAVTVMIVIVERSTKLNNDFSVLPLTLNKRHGYNF